MPQEIEVCCIQLPGRENRLMEAPFIRLLPLVEVLASVLQPYLVDPFAFYGHSTGGLISFELTRYLRRRYGPIPVHVFVSASRAPQLSRVCPSMHRLSDDEFLVELSYLGRTPKSVLENAELIQLLLPYLRADFALYRMSTALRRLSPVRSPSLVA
jgi:medium-chain acyl-[acyl-carrier-protein] hydrolase